MNPIVQVRKLMHRVGELANVCRVVIGLHFAYRSVALRSAVSSQICFMIYVQTHYSTEVYNEYKISLQLIGKFSNLGTICLLGCWVLAHPSLLRYISACLLHEGLYLCYFMFF